MPIAFRYTQYSFFFFFSSRRRHTRCLSDWSSDVCSSDLLKAYIAAFQAFNWQNIVALNSWRSKIGRASCRERVYISVVYASLKKKIDCKIGGIMVTV